MDDEKMEVGRKLLEGMCIAVTTLHTLIERVLSS